MLTGNKDVDRLIISYLDSKDILTVCQTNKYIYNICNEDFFRNLVYSKYPETVKYKDYVKVKNYKQHFLSIVYYINKLKRCFKIEYKGEGSPELEYFIRCNFCPYTFNIESAFEKLCENGNLCVVKYIIEKYNIKNEIDDGLVCAAAKGKLETVKYLTEIGADIHNIDCTYLNEAEAFTTACAYGHLPVVKYLVDKGVNIHADNNDALLGSCEYGHLSVVKFLIEKGADIHIDNDYPLILAKESKNIELVEYLQSF